MTVREALREGTLRLAERGIETPQLDAALLLGHALGVTRAQVLARSPEAVDPAALERYRGTVARRAGGLPVSYIVGRKEFYGLGFSVGPAVLVPRPDTELLVERALALAPVSARLHDACSGSGCVAISVSHERPDLEVSASDLSAEAAEVFAANCRAVLGRDLLFVLSDLLSQVSGTYHVITANPPYLTDGQVREMKASGWPEPALALAGGPDGLGPARRLIAQAPGHLEPGGWLALEADPQQMADLASSLRAAGFEAIAVSRDLAGRDRVIEARWAA